MPELIRGRMYTRPQIHDMLGGSIEKYLPHVDGKVVCGCFDPEKNPGAPFIVLPGGSEDRMKWASVFANQTHSIPCFVKRGTDSWEYVGDFRVVRQSFDSSEIKIHASRSGREEISQVLHLESE